MGKAAKGPKVIHRMATGGLVWEVPGSSVQIMWAGPGGRLLIGQIMKAGGASHAIDHHSANGSYTTAKEAKAAVAKFLAW